MSEIPTLFGHALREEILASRATFQVVERVVCHKRLQLDGKWFDAEDLRETLSNVINDDIVIEKTMGDALVRLKIITHRGSQRSMMGASPGENFQLLADLLDELLER